MSDKIQVSKELFDKLTKLTHVAPARIYVPDRPDDAHQRGFALTTAEYNELVALGKVDHT